MAFLARSGSALTSSNSAVVSIGSTSLACDSRAGMETWTLQPDSDNRSQGRSNVFLSAAVVAGASPVPVRVRNLSSRGALLDGGSLPAAGSTVRLVRGTLSAEGRIAWQSNGQAGIRFVREIDVAAWVKGTGHPGQQRVDEAVAALRRRQPPPPEVEPPSLTHISTELDALCERLAGSRDFSLELGEELVRLDALASGLRQLSRT
jgi:PilZ domain-containing protein